MNKDFRNIVFVYLLISMPITSFAEETGKMFADISPNAPLIQIIEKIDRLMGTKFELAESDKLHTETGYQRVSGILSICYESRGESGRQFDSYSPEAKLFKKWGVSYEYLTWFYRSGPKTLMKIKRIDVIWSKWMNGVLSIHVVSQIPAKEMKKHLEKKYGKNRNQDQGWGDWISGNILISLSEGCGSGGCESIIDYYNQPVLTQHCEKQDKIIKRIIQEQKELIKDLL